MNKWFLLPALVLLVVLSQYYLLSGALTLGFKPDDWILYFSYKLLGSNPLSHIVSVWSERGLYTTYQVYYLGLLDSLVGLNYHAFQLINLTFKILAALSLYPLTQILFKRKLLSFLSVILFSIAPSAVGPLEFVVKGSDYIAIIWMNLFFIVYFQIINNKLKSFKYHILLFSLLIFSLMFSPIRMFPIMIIPLLIEIFLVLKHFDRISNSFKRLLILYLPFIILIIFSRQSILGDAYGPFGILYQISKGNWYLLLAPISGIGSLFISNNFLGKIFGLILTDNFRNYLYFLLGGPTVILGLVTALIVWAKISRHKLFFFIVTTLLNFIFQVLIFYVAFHHLKITNSFTVNYDPINLYSVIFGGYIAVLGFIVFLNWIRSGMNDRILAAMWIGSAFLAIFTILTWIFAPFGTGFGSTSYYLVVASVGSSVMLGAFLVAIYDKIKLSKIKLLAFLPFVLLVVIFIMNGYIIHQRFLGLNKDGRGAMGQIQMQQEVRRVLASYRAGDDIFVYFDTSLLSGNGPFYSEGFLTSFPFFMHLVGGRVINGCVGVIYEDNKMLELRKLVNVQNGVKGFNYHALCVNGEKAGINNLFFSSDQFYAFKIKDKKLIDIKKSVLDQLSFK